MEALPCLTAAGFDIAHTFDAHTLGAAGFSRFASGPRLGVLIGNTRALWPRFVEAMRDPQFRDARDPLDRYTERTIADAFADHATACIYFGHRRYDGAFVPLQHLAVATGLGALAPSQLVVHPVYGPWFALRAVVLLDGDPPVRAPIDKPCACSDTCPRTVEVALSGRTTGEAWRPWLAVRDACSLREWRYSDEQIAFHYTKVWRP